MRTTATQVLEILNFKRKLWWNDSRQQCEEWPCCLLRSPDIERWVPPDACDSDDRTPDPVSSDTTVSAVADFDVPVIKAGVGIKIVLSKHHADYILFHWNIAQCVNLNDKNRNIMKFLSHGFTLPVLVVVTAADRTYDVSFKSNAVNG